MATITFIDNLPDPSLYGIDLYDFFRGSTEVVHTMDEANSKYILTSNLGRRIEYTYFVDASSVPHTTKAEYYVSDPTTLGASVLIATITDVDQTGYGLSLDALAGVDTVNGSNGSDALTNYGYGRDVLHGNGGDDVLTSSHTDTVLDGGTGNDTLQIILSPGLSVFAVHGGDGFDTVDMRWSGGTYAFRAVGEYAAVSGIEKILFSATSGSTVVRFQSDQISGLAHDLVVEKNTGSATIEITRAPGEAVDIDLSSWTFTGWPQDNLPYLQIVRYDLREDAAYDDKVIGTLFGELIQSYSGNDSIDGGLGNDTLVGGRGVDTVRGGDGDDVIALTSDDIEAGDIIDGGAGDDWLVCEGDLRATMISGIEHVRVSGGKTTQFANVFSSNISFETAGAQAALIQVYLSPGVELNAKDWSLGTWNEGSGIEIVGSVGADRIIAPMFKTTISGGDGVDTVRVDYASHTTSVVIDFGDGTLSEQMLANGTVLKGIEQFELIGGSARDILVGGAFHDTLSGGGSVDMLEGGAGNDYLDGGAGSDFMDGGLGNDTYVVSGADVIVDAGGIDKILVSSSFSIGTLTQIENLAMQAAASATSASLTGNALANMLTGNAGANTLQGMAGNDVLQGLGGNDKLAGGVGKDIFEFGTPLNSKLNVDTIMDFRAADDTIRLDDAVFTGLKRGQLAKSAFFQGTKAADKYDRIIYDKGTGALYFDADGAGSAKQILFAKLANKAAISYLDFVVI